MIQINWKLKALLYKVFGIFRLKIFFIQKHITKRSRVEINQVNELWIHHADAIEKNNAKNILEVGAGKSLEQNIYISYKFNNLINNLIHCFSLLIILCTCLRWFQSSLGFWTFRHAIHWESLLWWRFFY